MDFQDDDVVLDWFLTDDVDFLLTLGLQDSQLKRLKTTKNLLDIVFVAATFVTATFVAATFP